MKFKFSKDLDYQKDAINAIVDIFDTGRNLAHEPFRLREVTPIISNELEIDESRILFNVKAIQNRHGIEPSDKLGSMDFSIEMETGTGKTYVYLRTILELFKKYGLTKFIILVPSVAIREGVLKTFEQTQLHFKELYNTSVNYFAYDSSKLSQVREFSQGIDLQVMIMTIQSFNDDSNIMRQTPDRFHGERPIDMVAATAPVIIMDEPQNMTSELSKAAIADLKPLFKLRYSATHKELHNLMYRLTPIDAYKKNLVKRIQVFGVTKDDAGDFVFKVQSIEAKKGQSPRAKVQLEVKNAAEEYLKKEVTIKVGDDLFNKTDNDKYANLMVNDVNAQYNRIELSDGKYYQLEAEIENKEQIFRTQIKETIKAHLDKQTSIGDIAKVLSLFFIDKVDNYVTDEGIIRKMFIEEFEKLKRNYLQFSSVNVDRIHKGYFASKKEKGKEVFKDTRGDSTIDKDAYDLIMKDKERLLSFSEPVCFIFSHSALKEGWDNPNIFQICTLRETNSLMKKRQEIGRGLRLPVDINGDRIFSQDINVLTVIANESYQEYVGKLQQEFTEAGYASAPEARNAEDKRVPVNVSKKYITDTDFLKLWEKISKRTKYTISIITNKLIKNSVDRIDDLDIGNLVVTVDKVNVYFDNNGKVETTYSGKSAGERINQSVTIGNVVDRISREVGLTKETVSDILSKVKNLKLLFENPEEYTRSIIVTLNNELRDLLLGEGLEYVPTGDSWQVKLLFKESECFENKSITSAKSAFDRIPFDSDGERKFAQSLENSSNVKVYTKLPRGFKIDTPIGEYIPDWAIVWKATDGDKLYLVRETKFGYKDLSQEINKEEEFKILSAHKHFKAIDFDEYRIAEKEDLSDLLTNEVIRK